MISVGMTALVCMALARSSSGLMSSHDLKSRA